MVGQHTQRILFLGIFLLLFVEQIDFTLLSNSVYWWDKFLPPVKQLKYATMDHMFGYYGKI